MRLHIKRGSEAFGPTQTKPVPLHRSPTAEPQSTPQAVGAWSGILTPPMHGAVQPGSTMAVRATILRAAPKSMGWSSARCLLAALAALSLTRCGGAVTRVGKDAGADGGTTCSTDSQCGSGICDRTTCANRDELPALDSLGPDRFYGQACTSKVRPSGRD